VPKKKIEVWVGWDTTFPSKLIADAEKDRKPLESEGVSIEFPYRDKNFQFPIEIFVTLVVTFTSTVAAQVFASWLYDKIKGRATKIVIEKTEVRIDEIDEKSIRKILLKKTERNE
jgi:hypothetical protein